MNMTRLDCSHFHLSLVNLYRKSKNQTVMVKLRCLFVLFRLHYKQSKYPVMIITSGENEKYFYMDIRNRTRKIAANFSILYNMLVRFLFSCLNFDSLMYFPPICLAILIKWLTSYISSTLFPECYKCC